VFDKLYQKRKINQFYLLIKMYRSYRMRHERNPADDLIDDHQPTRIIVGTMTGIQHTLFTEHDGETFLDVKNALLPYVDIPLHRLSLSLRMEDGSFDIDVDDSRLVKTLDNRDVNLELVIRDLTMNADQQVLIDKWTRDALNRRQVLVYDRDVNRPYKMEAFLFYLNNNHVTILRIMFTDIHHIMIIMRFIVSNNIPIKNLEFQGDPEDMDPDEMTQVFEMIRQINTLRVLRILNVKYRMNDLTDLLDQTSLHRVYFDECIIILDEDVTRLSHVLMTHPTLWLVQLSGRSQSDENVVKDFMESFDHIIPNHKDRREILPDPDMIHLYWKNPNK
jgi:hypothetical protein